MEIDWITVSAQIVNFLILVWLLKRFLYQPVIRAMDRREQRITDRLTDAREREEKADEAAEHYRQKRGELEQRREEILAGAEEEAEQKKKQMIEEARAHVADSRAQWQQQVERERGEFLVNLRQRTVDAVQAVARKALDDLADADLEDRVVHKFTEQLKSLDKETRVALADSNEPARITTAFELASPSRAALTRAVHDNIAAEIDVDYHISAELICGIELSRGGQRLGWNMKEYLDSLAARTEEAFKPLETDTAGSPEHAPAVQGEGN